MLAGVLFIDIEKFREWFEENFELPFWVKVQDDVWYFSSGDIIGKVYRKELYGRQYLVVHIDCSVEDWVRALEDIGDEIAWMLLVMFEVV